MIKVIYTHIAGSLTADISDTLTLLPLDAASIAAIQAAVNFAGGDWTYLRLDNGVYFEEVKAIDTTGSYLVIERGVSGSTPKAFSALDTIVSDVVGVDAITDIIAANPPTIVSNVTADGLAYNAGTEANPIIKVDPPNYTGDGNVEVLGAYPNIQFALNLQNSGCCPGEGSGAGSGDGVASLTIDSGILQGSIVGQVLNLVLPAPSFTGAGTVAVTGVYPNYTITGASSTGGGSVVSVNVGAGLTLTGSPSVNPTISITNTGVVAGDYSGFVVNARGQITALPIGFNPISDITIAAGGTVARTGGSMAITLADADVGVKGIVALADESAPLNPADAASAVSPALLAAYLAGSGSGSGAAGTSTGEADASYTDLQGATAVTLELATGKTALLTGQVQILDNTAPLTPVAFGVAVFDGTGVKKYATKSCTQSLQAIGGHIVGPFSGTLVIKTTALPAGSTLQSAHLGVIVL